VSKVFEFTCHDGSKEKWTISEIKAQIRYILSDNKRNPVIPKSSTITINEDERVCVSGIGEFEFSTRCEPYKWY